MPAKETASYEPTYEPGSLVPVNELQNVLVTLTEVFASFRNQLREETPPPFEGNARVAADVFNDIVAGVRLQPAITIAVGALSRTEIELTWTEETNRVEGYIIKRCKGSQCQELVEISRLGPGARVFRDGNLSANTIYRYQVVAFNIQGEAASSVAEVTTKSNPA